MREREIRREREGGRERGRDSRKRKGERERDREMCVRYIVLHMCMRHDSYVHV